MGTAFRNNYIRVYIKDTLGGSELISFAETNQRSGRLSRINLLFKQK